MAATETAVELASEPDFRLGQLLIRPSSREAILDGRTELEEPRVLQVLTVLARRRGEVVSREQLVAACWSGRVVSEDAVNRSITKVRRWSTPATFTLETIPRVGYRLVVTELSLDNPANASAAASDPPPPPAPPRRSRWKQVLLAAIAVFILGGGYMAWTLTAYLRDTSAFFAVLPFDAVGSDSDVVDLAEELSTTINNRLTGQNFKVASPTLIAQYRGARKAEAAAALTPRYIVDGTVRRKGNRISVAVRIDSGVNPITVWSREFDASVEAARQLPDSISIVLAGLFNPTMQTNPRLPPDVAAGMLHINGLRTEGRDLDAYVAAKEFLRKVPTHYTPQIWYAVSVAEAIDLMPPPERAGLIAEARSVAENADRITWGSLPTVHSLLTPTVEWSAREERLRAGLNETGSDVPGVRYMLSSLLLNVGRIDEGVALAKLAVSVHPLSTRNVAGQASALDIAGRSEQADAVLDKAVQLWPSLEAIERLRFDSAMTRGDLHAASTMLQDPTLGPLINPPAERQPIATLLRALEKRDPTDIAIVERDCADPAKLARDRLSWCLRGLVALGRLDSFFEIAPAYFPELRGASPEERDARWLQAPRVNRYVRVLFRSDMQAMRADPRFIPITERLGLLEYWRQSGKWPDFCKTEPNSVCDRMRYH